MQNAQVTEDIIGRNAGPRIVNRLLDLGAHDLINHLTFALQSAQPGPQGLACSVVVAGCKKRIKNLLLFPRLTVMGLLVRMIDSSFRSVVRFLTRSSSVRKVFSKSKGFEADHGKLKPLIKPTLGLFQIDEDGLCNVERLRSHACLTKGSSRGRNAPAQQAIRYLRRLKTSNGRRASSKATSCNGPISAARGIIVGACPSWDRPITYASGVISRRTWPDPYKRDPLSASKR